MLSTSMMCSGDQKEEGFLAWNFNVIGIDWRIISSTFSLDFLVYLVSIGNSTKIFKIRN